MIEFVDYNSLSAVADNIRSLRGELKGINGQSEIKLQLPKNWTLGIFRLQTITSLQDSFFVSIFLGEPLSNLSTVYSSANYPFTLLLLRYGDTVTLWQIFDNNNTSVSPNVNGGS